jgi:sRNA-binding regulator protein Hfq
MIKIKKYDEITIQLTTLDDFTVLYEEIDNNDFLVYSHKISRLNAIKNYDWF